jgi:TPP-dependent pyruvate/acetoin dehydrogenase alpha subunit
VDEVTQPQGHSTSGSHERYKTKERLQWEADHDCLLKMREWIINEVLVLPEEVDEIEKEAKVSARDAKDRAWKAFNVDIQKDIKSLHAILDRAIEESRKTEELTEIKEILRTTVNPIRMDCVRAAKRAVRLYRLD